MLGNVARYINSSCSPNCYTQVITAGGNKRIVLYAKRDIRRGEEICYDYKFNLEEDQCAVPMSLWCSKLHFFINLTQINKIKVNTTDKTTAVLHAYVAEENAHKNK